MAAALGPSAEIIVVDGGSSDDTVERAAGRARIVRSPGGRGRQLDAGARSAGGDVLLFLHADSWPNPESGKALAAALARPDVVGGCFQVRLRGPSAHRPIARILARAISARSRLFRTATGDQAIFCRRSVYADAGGFARYELFEDVIFYRRLRRLGKVVVLNATVHTSDRRWRANGYLRTIATHLGLRLLFLLGVAPNRLAKMYGQPAQPL